MGRGRCAGCVARTPPAELGGSQHLRVLPSPGPLTHGKRLDYIPSQEQAMLQDPARVDDLFPTAKELFDRIASRRKAASWVAWTVGAGPGFLLSPKALRLVERQ